MPWVPLLVFLLAVMLAAAARAPVEPRPSDQALRVVAPALR